MDLSKINFRVFRWLGKDGAYTDYKTIQDYLSMEATARAKYRETVIGVHTELGSAGIYVYLYERPRNRLNTPYELKRTERNHRIFELNTRTDKVSLEDALKTVMDFAIEKLTAEADGVMSCAKALCAMQN